MSAIVNIACIWRQPGFDKGDRIWNSASTFRARVRACVRTYVRIRGFSLSLLRGASRAYSSSFSLSHPLSVILSPARACDTPGCAPSSSATPMSDAVHVVAPLNDKSYFDPARDLSPPVSKAPRFRYRGYRFARSHPRRHLSITESRLAHRKERAAGTFRPKTCLRYR